MLTLISFTFKLQYSKCNIIRQMIKVITGEIYAIYINEDEFLQSTMISTHSGQHIHNLNTNFLCDFRANQTPISFRDNHQSIPKDENFHVAKGVRPNMRLTRMNSFAVYTLNFAFLLPILFIMVKKIYCIDSYLQNILHLFYMINQIITIISLSITIYLLKFQKVLPFYVVPDKFQI